MIFRIAVLTAIFAAQTLAQRETGNCYNLGISTPRVSNYTQCGTSNMCCRTNDTRPDSCASGDLLGLCVSGNQEIWRESCTEQRWDQGGCVKLCMDTYVTNTNETIVRAAMDYRITRCVADGSLCCGAPGSDEAGECCNAKRGVFLDNLKVVNTKPTAGISSQILSVTSSTSSATSSPSGSAGASSDSKSKTGAIVGGVVGGVVGGLGGIAIIAVVIWLLLRRRKQQSNIAEVSGENQYPNEKYRSQGELPGDNRRYDAELHGGNVAPVEMDGSTRK